MSDRNQAQIKMERYRTPAHGHRSGASLQVIAFEAGGIQFAVDIADVTSIVMPQAAISSPQLPDYILGAIALRGHAVAVLDLRTRFGLPSMPAGETYKGRIVVVRSGNTEAGIAVDAVSEIAWLRLFGPEFALNQVECVDQSYLRGIGFKTSSTGDAHYPVAVLEVGRILRDCSDNLSAARAALDTSTTSCPAAKVIDRSQQAA